MRRGKASTLELKGSARALDGPSSAVSPGPRWTSVSMSAHMGAPRGHCSGFNSTHCPPFTSNLNLGILFGMMIFIDIIKVRTEVRSCCMRVV